MEYTGYKSDTSIRIGLTNLLENEIIARGRVDNLYFINPMVGIINTKEDIQKIKNRYKK